MNKQFFILLMFVLAAYGQAKEKVAIINTVDDGSPPISHSELNYLTKKLRGIAVDTLKNYDIMTDDYIIDISGSQEEADKKCEDAGGCLAKLGREIKVHYIAQARIGRLGKDLTITAELYDTRSSKLLGSLEGEAKDVYGLMSVLEAKAPDMFRKMLGTSGSSKTAQVFIPGGIGGVEIKGTDYEFTGEKRYLASISSDPEGATLSFNGVPNSRCAKTPCSAELGEGSIRIIASLEQYEIADTTVSIRQNNQSIHIRMKANFGVLEIKPAYSDGIGYDERWNLTINGNAASWESRLSPGKYNVELSHRCYEAISFEAGINKDKREVFDMAEHIKLKKGGLDLSVEADGEPVGEPVFVNGRQVGETPFRGSVPVCAKVEIGEGREAVDVEIEHNASKRYTHQMNTEERQRRELARQEAEQRWREQQKQEWEKQEELAKYKRPWFVLGGGCGESNSLFIFINPEFVSVADGHLSFGVDVDLGNNEFRTEGDTTSALFFRGGTSAKLSFGEKRWWYLTAGASWYVDMSNHSVPSFSVGTGVRVVGYTTNAMLGLQYSIMPMNNHNMIYWEVKAGFPFPGWL